MHNFVSKLGERDNDDRAHDVVEIMVWLATADQRVTAESGITRYLASRASACAR